ncbi:hypothetical protein ABFS82_05G127600 [Erythranthe guttata]|uniref:peptidylprolyl isomerase n=1 Tax=Erythranthe guttata TaxID=4155 RepID=A0A022QRT8_ERYGU|nr:PREDICTED: peptidyl-prolyl cis-trans isomerase CYP95-like isoform X2 [Erythranthe guttata]EYU29230.1 hypothetical protein MIMGU_mgv1a002072mg [Erythranthe guttata]|eukprot:XP_012847113.1 PREDICTED: peptidyl-prolyl cis-trans isomerase CYP95-like isoform X2 [Erythranthe guttata]
MMEKMSKRKPLVFFDVSVDGDPLERMVFELFTDVAPRTAENFRALCTGEKGASLKTGRPLHYKGTFFHRIIKGYVAQGGDFLRRDGKHGESIYGGKFPEESPKLKHDSPGLLSMAIADRGERGSLFSITFEADHNLDRKNIVFGKLVEGEEVLKKIENAGDKEGRPVVLVKIVNSGEINDDAHKGNKLKLGKDAIEENNHALKRKGKHKKTSKKRRKRRRRYYTSESESSTDTDTDSSESDTDSDSDTSSLSDTSSSGDDRRKRRKRSKRDKHRHGKRKNRRHEKRRKRRDKKSKHKSKRNIVSDSESEGKTGGISQNDIAVADADVKHTISGNPSLVAEQEFAKTNDKKWEGADISEREDGEFPRENGDHQSNGIGQGIDSEQSAGRHHYKRPSKSRSRSISPVRTSTSPRTAVRSPSPSVSRSPQQISDRSRSNTPIRSGGSISPRPRPHPPVRSLSQRSRSRSATVSPPRRRLTRSPPRTSSKRSSLRSASRSPVRSSRRSISRSPVRAPLRRSPSQSPNPSPIRAPSRRTNRPSHSNSPVSAGRRARSPVSRSPSVDGSPKRVRRGRGFSDRFSFVRRYRSRSPDRSPVRPNRYGARNDRDRYSSYRRSPRRYRSPPRGRTPPRYRGRRSRSRSPSVSRSPIRIRGRRYSKSPIRSRSPVRRRSPPSRSRSLSKSPSPRHSGKVNPKSSPSASASPPRKTGLVSYGNGSPDSSRD